jgi:hypothetical protein
MNTKHTPGPWTAEAESELERRTFVCAKDHAIADCMMGYGGEDEANARLIAAAPELLDALTAIYNGANPRARYVGRDAKEYVVAKELVDAARAAILKSQNG